MKQRLTALVASTIVLLVATPGGASAEDADAFGNRYRDGLDTRYSAIRLEQAAASLGYASQTRTNGASSDVAFNEVVDSAVVGFFGHSAGGVVQLTDGHPDELLAAGTATMPVSIYTGVRFLSEALPFVDVDDLRLLILAGCDTADVDPTVGDFKEVTKARGVDSVVTFRDKVFFPDTASAVDPSTTNYSGNYFWARFSTYIRDGDTVATALGRARTDLRTKEGSLGGWGSQVITGSVASPGNVRLTGAPAGTALTSAPTAPVAPMALPASLAELHIASERVEDSPHGAAQSTSTVEGVHYRRSTETGELIDLIAPASTSGAVDYSLDETATLARQAALTWADLDVTNWATTGAVVSHADTDSLAVFDYTARVGGRDRALTIEIDRRTGELVYLSSSWTTVAGPATGTVTAAEAARAAVAATAASAEPSSVTALRWGTPQWVVTIPANLPTGRRSSGPASTITSEHRVLVDAITGNVVSKEKS